MTSYFGRLATATTGALVALAASIIHAGTVAADPLVGKTYADATAQIKDWKATPVLSTVVGDQVEMAKCLVASWRKESKSGKIFLSLYCDANFANGNDPGYSAASREGRTAKEHAANVEYLQSHPEKCRELKSQHPDWFKQPVEGCENAF